MLLFTYLTLFERLRAPCTERNGSAPITSIPSSAAAFATNAPIAPRPMTPSFLPFISGPTNWLLPFSTSLPTSSPLPFKVFAQSIAAVTLRLLMSRPSITSSFTAFALAPGVLNTTIPFSLHLSTGILFTPAPALAIASKSSPSSISCIEAERTSIACGLSISSPTVYLLLSRRSVPQAAILFNVFTLYIGISSCTYTVIIKRFRLQTSS